MIIQKQLTGHAASLIDLIWLVDERDLPDTKRDDIIAPSGHIHVVYNFSAPYYLLVGDDFQEVPNMVLAGQYKKPYHIRYGQNAKLLGLAIHPLAFYKLFGELSGIYTGAVVDCSAYDAMKKIHDKIHEIVESETCGQVIVDKVEGIFESIVESTGDGEESGAVEDLEAMIAYIEDHKGLIDIKAMAVEFAYSLSALERQFKNKIGLTPKAYADIIRFRYAVVEASPETLFYDQSHFIKNCRKYTDKLPATLMDAQEISLLYILGLKER